MKIKSYLIAFLLSGLLFPVAHAQVSSMSDQQVMDFVIKENDKGTSREDIVKKLIERGVPIEQIRSIRDKYERENGTGQIGARDLTGSKPLTDRSRRSGGNLDDEKGDGFYQRRKQQTKVKESELSKRQRDLLREKREDQYNDEMSFLLPDSLEMYENALGWEKDEKQGKQVFGRNIFNREYLSFEPEMNIATPADYRLGPGDAVYIDVWGASQKSYTGTVSPEGEVYVEDFGPVNLSGMTVAQANQHLRHTLGARFGGSNVKLTVGETRTISVNVMGEVEVPGTYTLSAFATVFHALYMAGGTNEIGTLRNIKVYRNGKLITTVDVYDYILGGNLKGNVRLASGDVIIVGTYDCLVAVSGKVKRPMYYEMKSTESVGTLLQYAGGFSGDAYQNTLRLIRKSGGKYSVYTIDEFERDGFRLTDGDSVFVDSVLNRYTNMVEVKGAVFREGMYQMDGNITSVRQLLEKAGGPTEEAFQERAILYRRKEDRSLEAMSINLKGLMEHQVADISLRNEDVLYIPSKQFVNEERILTITGEVNYPGTYDYIENLTLEDFILQAGGLKDAASMVKVDVSRRVRDKKAVTTSSIVAQSFSFSLKDGFVVDGEPGFALEPFDEVFVRRSPGYVEQEHVTVTGEVSFSGTYVLTKKGTRLSDIIKAAGGLSDEAYAKGARLERLLSPAEKLKQESMLKLISSDDSANIKKYDLADTRYIGINLNKAMENPGNDEWDIVLQDGDKLIVPQFNNTVSINGEVMYPNTVAYKKGAKLNYYINQAGGFSLKAKQNRVFAVNMNGTVTRVKSAKDIQPGCEIVVPAKQKKRGLSLAEIMSLGTVTATLGTVIATLVK